MIRITGMRGQIFVLCGCVEWLESRSHGFAKACAPFGHNGKFKQKRIEREVEKSGNYKNNGQWVVIASPTRSTT
jgi:hypothetical protein